MKYRFDVTSMATVLAQVRVLLATGQPLPEGLKTMSARMPRLEDRELAEQLSKRLEAGTALSDALVGLCPGMPPLAISLLKAGEEGEDLAKAVQALVEFQQSETRLLRRIDAATLYPRLVVLVAIAVVLPLLAWCARSITSFTAIPGVAEAGRYGLVDAIVDGNLSRALDACIRMGLDGVRLLGRLALMPYDAGVVGWLVMSLVAYLVLFRPIGPIATLVRAVTLRLRAIGPALKNAWAATFTTSVGLLLHHGVTLERAVSLAGGFSSDPGVQAELARIRRELVQGRPLSEALTDSRLFPDSLAWFAAVGERGEKLEQSMFEAARYYRGEAEYLGDFLVQALEPITMVALGLVFGAVIISQYLPIVRLINAVN